MSSQGFWIHYFKQLTYYIYLLESLLLRQYKGWSEEEELRGWMKKVKKLRNTNW